MNIYFSHSIAIRGTAEDVFYRGVHDPDMLVKGVQPTGPVPGVRAARFDNDVRLIFLTNGAELRETLTRTGPLSLEYRVERFPFPFSLISESAVGRYEVTEAGDAVTYTWSATHKLTSPVAILLAWPLKTLFVDPMMKGFVTALKNTIENRAG